jgi:peptide/nickel transport system substrate-binding protein
MYSQLKSGRWDRRKFLQQAFVVGLGVPMIGALIDTALPGGLAAAATINRGGTGTIGTNAPTLLPDPATVLDQGGIVATQIAGEYLMVPDIHWNLQPALASTYKMKNASTHVFTIRPGVMFHNGQNLTAADVVQTFRSLVAKGSAASSTYAGILKSGGVVATGPMEVTFHLEVPWVGFAYLCSPFAYQSIILPANYKVGSFMTTPQGTGAYMVKSYTPGVGATYVANPKYWNSAKAGPYMDGINLVFYSDTSAGVLSMAAGSYDYMPAVSYGTGQELFYTKGVSIQSHASTSYRSVQMRVDKGQPLANVHKRLAIASCLDRKGMVASLLGGYGTVANDSYMAPAFPTSALAIKKLPQRSQNIREAKKFLAQAGVPRGFKVTLTTEAVYEIPLLAQTIKANCAQAGIDINLKVTDQNDYYNEWTSVPMGITDWSARGIPAQGLQYYTAGNSWNTAHWADRKFDTALTHLNSASTPRAAVLAGFSIAREMYHQVPVAIPYWIDDTQAYATGVTIGYAPSTLVNVTNMHLPAGHK